MHLVDSASAVPSMPAPLAAGTPGWYANTGNATVTTADWANALQAEILNVLSAANIGPSKVQQNQLLQAIQYLIAQRTRTVLSAPLTLYVAPGGSDASGLGTSGQPFASIQRALNYLYSSYDLGGQTVTVNVAAGTYASGIGLVGPCAGQVSAIVVAGAGAGSTILNYSSSNGLAVSVSNGANLAISGMTVNATNSSCLAAFAGGVISPSGMTLTASGSGGGYWVGGGWLMEANLGGVITFGTGMTFGACGVAHMSAGSAGMVQSNGNAYTISGGGLMHANAGVSGAVRLNGSAVTLSGTPAFSGAFAGAYEGGAVEAQGMTFSGSATGQKYSAQTNGVINTNGGASYLPGSTAGAVASGGQYV